MSDTGERIPFARRIAIFFLFAFAIVFITGCHLFTPETLSGNLSETENSQVFQEPVVLTPLANAKMYLVAIDDAGKSGTAIGCGDSLVPVEIQVESGREALEHLLNQHSSEYDQSGLYNALHRSELDVVRFDISPSAIGVDLKGSLVQGGVCDIPRIQSQLESTIRQSTGKEPPVIIRVNGILLSELLSLK